MSKQFPQHIDASVKITEGPGQPPYKPSGPDSLKFLLERVRRLEARERELCATKKKNGYRLHITFDENGGIQAYSSGGKVSEEFTCLLTSAKQTHDFNPHLLQKKGRLNGEGVVCINGKEVGHSGMPKALMLLRRCKDAGIDPKEIGLEPVVYVFALSSLGVLKPYQLYSKAFELQQLKELTAVTRKGDPGAQPEWTVLRVVESITFRVEPDGRILDGAGGFECQAPDFGKHLLQKYGEDDEGFVVYAHNSKAVANGNRFVPCDGKFRSRTFTKVLPEFRGVFALRRENPATATLFTVLNRGDTRMVRVGSMPLPGKWQDTLTMDEYALYPLRCTWVYSSGSVAGVKNPWGVEPEQVSADTAYQKVTPISEIVAGNRHREAVMERERRLEHIETTVLPQVLAKRADARAAPDTRTTRDILETARGVLPPGAHKFLPADSHTMRSVQVAQSAPDLQRLSLDDQILARYVDRNGLSNDVADVRRRNETVVITDLIEMPATTYQNLCDTYHRPSLLVLPLRWLVDSIQQGRYLPTDGYCVVEEARPVKRTRALPAAEPGPGLQATETGPEPAPEATRPRGLVRCYTNGLGPVSQR